ncbi:hypothetical protein TrLO_g1142 [Triparma laevis f. longispina]|uniref:Uncharacterized protein n=1 Tax=Triparma laevis f. longispina TaxID=1714387 RepID=A0A9W7C7F0_9STRA|nr:hypothetical protein TrLO_g1142 [Triparma laevis f. longispina]
MSCGTHSHPHYSFAISSRVRHKLKYLNKLAASFLQQADPSYNAPHKSLSILSDCLKLRPDDVVTWLNILDILKDTASNNYVGVIDYEPERIVEEMLSQFASQFASPQTLSPAIPKLDNSYLTAMHIQSLKSCPTSSHLLHSYFHHLTTSSHPPPPQKIHSFKSHIDKTLLKTNPYILKSYYDYLLLHNPDNNTNIDNEIKVFEMIKSYLNSAPVPSTAVLQDIVGLKSIEVEDKVEVVESCIEKLSANVDADNSVAVNPTTNSKSSSTKSSKTKQNDKDSNKNLTECYLILSKVYTSSSQTSLARATLEKGVTLSSSSSWCSIELKKLNKQTWQIDDLKKVCTDMDKNTHQSATLFRTWAKMEGDKKTPESNLRALEILYQAKINWPEDGRVHLEEGRIYEKMGDTLKAKICYRESLKFEKNGEAFIKLAKFARGRKKTVAWYETAVRFDREDGRVWNSYGSYLGELGLFEEAREVFEQGEKAKYDRESVYHGRGRMELRAGEWEYFREGLKIEGGTRRVRDFLSHSLGMVLLNEHEIEEARRVFYDGLGEEGVEGERANSRLLLGAALCEVRQGKDSKARALFEKSVTRDPKHSHAWQAWGVLESKAGNYREARELFEVGIKNCKTHPALWQALARMENKCGNVKEARKLYKVGCGLCKKSVSLIVDAAGLEMREGNFKKGRKLLEKALALDGKDGRVWCGLVRASMQEGSCEVTEPPPYADIVAGVDCADAASIKLMEKGLAAVGEEDNIQLRTKDKKETGAKAEYAEKIRAKLAKEARGNNNDDTQTSPQTPTNQSLSDPSSDNTFPEVKYGGLRGRVELLKLSGEIYSRVGRWDRARASFERALELDPNCAQLYHSYAQLEAILFNLEGLNRLNKRAEEIFSKTEEGRNSLGGRGKADMSEVLFTDMPLPSQVQRIREQFGDDVQFDDIVLEGSGTMELLELPPDE